MVDDPWRLTAPDVYLAISPHALLAQVNLLAWYAIYVSPQDLAV